MEKKNRTKKSEVRKRKQTDSESKKLGKKKRRKDWIVEDTSASGIQSVQTSSGSTKSKKNHVEMSVRKQKQSDSERQKLGKKKRRKNRIVRDASASEIQSVQPFSVSTQATASNDTVETIVPWCCKTEWEAVGKDVQDDLYEAVVETLTIWKERVPTLPVGAEVTLLIAQAFAYDKEEQENFCPDRARSLFGLALIRYTNHVGHCSAYALGGKSTLPTRDLAAIAATPDWLISLRNDVSHGTNIPTLESLRVAGHFICDWLKDRYWKESTVDNLLEKDSGVVELKNYTLEGVVTDIVNAFLATRIFNLRGVNRIHDLSIIKYSPTVSIATSTSISTKQITKEILTTIKNFIVCVNEPVIPLLTKELIPSKDFFQEFSNLVSESRKPDEKEKEGFQGFVNLWNPILAILQRKGKLLAMCEYLLDVRAECANEPFICWLAASWIDHLLRLYEEKNGLVFKSKLFLILKKAMLSPDCSSKIFFQRLIKLAAPKLGESTVKKISYLISLYTDDIPSKTRTRKPGSWFTIKDCQSYMQFHEFSYNDDEPQEDSSAPAKAGWSKDSKGSNFWKEINFGTVLNEVNYAT